jgi:hypothetical protein
MAFAPREGDFGLCRGAGLAMAAVRLGTFSRYGHAATCEEVRPDGRIVIIEPMPSGCRRRVARPQEFVWSDVALTDAQRAAVVAYARGLLGAGYDWPAIAGFVRRWWAHRLLPWRRPGLLPPRYTDGPLRRGRIMCSEAQVRGYREAGVDLGRGRPAEAVSPGDLRQWLDDQRRAARR